MTTADKIIQICDDADIHIEALYRSQIEGLETENVLIISVSELAIRCKDEKEILRRLEILVKGEPNHE